jgi:5-hydroxyisourate hydrolase-like protein (transthyretin family)
MSISVEILDCAFGRAAEGVWVTLLREVDSGWRRRASDRTDATGAVAALEPAPERGRYRLVVDLDQYYPPLGTEPAVSQAEVTFRVFRPGERVRMLVAIRPGSCLAIRRNGGS